MSLDIDWNDLRTVLAIARHGSLGKAGRVLGTTQPTLGRRLDQIERRVGVKLFERATTGLTPTPLCAALLEPLSHMEEGALAAERCIAARDTGLQGSISVTSLDWLGDHVLAPIAAAFCALHPQVSLELLSEGRVFNLSRREADVSLRFKRFDQEDLVMRSVGEVSYGLYAAESYLREHGRPDFDAGCEGHSLVTLHEEAGRVCQVDWLLTLAPKARVVLRASGIHAHLAAASAGIAVAALPRCLADQHAGLVRLSTSIAEPRQPVYLGVHAEMRDVPRLRAFIDFTVDAISRAKASLAPQ